MAVGYTHSERRTRFCGPGMIAALEHPNHHRPPGLRLEGSDLLKAKLTRNQSTIMIKAAFSLFVVCGAIAPSLKAVPPAIAEFTAGDKTKYSTLNHEKAKGLNMTISFPNSWEAKEGDRPNIVQKFVSDGGAGLELFMIVTKSLPPGTTFTEEELTEFFTENSLKEFVPDGATFISGNATKIEGLQAGILEFSKRGERAGVSIDMQTINYIFFSGSTMVQIVCQVGSLPGSPISARDRMNEFKPLFTLIASSTVLPDKWK